MFARLRTRLILSSLVIVAIVLGLLGFILYVQINFNQRVQRINDLRLAAAYSRDLSLYAQYNAYDINAYMLGHLEHQAEFQEHAATALSTLALLDASLANGILDEDEATQLGQIKLTRRQYESAAQAFFQAIDAQRTTPSAANQAAAEASWEVADTLSHRLDEEAQELTRRINRDIEEHLPRVESSNQQILVSMVVVGSILVGLLLLVQGMAARTVGKPLRTLLLGVQSFAAGNLQTRLAIQRRDEIGELAEAFNSMAGRLQEQHQALEARNQELQQSLQTQQQLFSTVQQLSAPLLPIGNGVVVLPIIGHVDAARADAILQTLLHGVARQRAYCAILDVTGIAMMDIQVLQLLLQMVEATELLGSKVLLAGITSAMAQVIVAQQVNIGSLRTYRDLGSAIEAAQSLRSGFKPPMAAR